MTTKRLRKIIMGGRFQRNQVNRMVAFGRKHNLTNWDTLKYFEMIVFFAYDRDRTPVPWEGRAMDDDF